MNNIYQYYIEVNSSNVSPYYISPIRWVDIVEKKGSYFGRREYDYPNASYFIVAKNKFATLNVSSKSGSGIKLVCSYFSSSELTDEEIINLVKQYLVRMSRSIFNCAGETALITPEILCGMLRDHIKELSDSSDAQVNYHGHLVHVYYCDHKAVKKFLKDNNIKAKYIHWTNYIYDSIMIKQHPVKL